MIRRQIALVGTQDFALDMLSAVRPYVNMAKIGTPLIYREGMRALSTIHRKYPDLSLLADLKIMDAGAGYVTVLGVAQDATIEGTLRSARCYD
jgi:3-hexulose-6-phosphate synthase